MASSTSLQFQLKIGSLGADSFRVLEFTLDETISECFQLHMQASSSEPDVPYDDMIGQDATLTVKGKDFEITHHGMVTEFNQYPDAGGNFGHESFLYDIVVEPRLKRLAFTTQSRIFHKKKLKDIVTEALQGHNLAMPGDFDFKLKGTLREREYTVQYNETDLDFVCRLLEDEGIFYYFDHSGEKEKMIIGDNVDAMTELPNTPKVDFMGEAGLSHLQADAESPDHVSKLRRTQRMITGKASIKDYNDRTPDTTVMGTESGAGEGEDYQYGPQALNTGEAGRIAGLRTQAHAALKIKLEGSGICRDFRAGMRFELVDAHGPGHLDGKYTLLRVRHHGDQREGFESDQNKLIYENAFECIPADRVFRPSLKTPKPKIPGFLSAKVDGVSGKYAYLDEDGRYKAKLPFDLTSAHDGAASLPIRMNQPYGGPNYGTHFPIHIGNEILLAFENGDPDRPVALGTVPNPSNGSPVNKRNASESIIRTASGHQIKLDDKEGKTVIEIITKGKHVITLNDDPDHQEIRIKSTNANELVFDDKNKHITMQTPEGAHILKMDYDKKVFSVDTKYGHKLTMDDEAKKIAVQTKQNHILALDDDKKLITLQDGKGKHVFQIDVGNSKVAITTEGDLAFSAKGTLNIEAKEINMEAKQGAINVKAMKDIAMEGMNFNAKGKQKLVLEGTSEASLGAVQVKVEGKASVDISSKGQTKVGGLQVSVAGQVMSEIKGAMVMIN